MSEDGGLGRTRAVTYRRGEGNGQDGYTQPKIQSPYSIVVKFRCICDSQYYGHHMQGLMPLLTLNEARFNDSTFYEQFHLLMEYLN